ncbi:MAG: hypothetical protein ACU0CO_03580 [Shimia sp.]
MKLVKILAAAGLVTAMASSASAIGAGQCADAGGIVNVAAGTCSMTPEQIQAAVNNGIISPAEAAGLGGGGTGLGGLGGALGGAGIAAAAAAAALLIVVINDDSSATTTTT